MQKRRNEPAWVPLVGETVAQVHGVELADLARATRDNAIRLFRLNQETGPDRLTTTRERGNTG